VRFLFLLLTKHVTRTRYVSHIAQILSRGDVFVFNTRGTLIV